MGNETWTSFAGNRRIVTGALNEMLMATKVHLDAGGLGRRNAVQTVGVCKRQGQQPIPRDCDKFASD